MTLQGTDRICWWIKGRIGLIWACCVIFIFCYYTCFLGPELLIIVPNNLMDGIYWWWNYVTYQFKQDWNSKNKFVDIFVVTIVKSHNFESKFNESLLLTDWRILKDRLSTTLFGPSNNFILLDIPKKREFGCLG